jgi:hypothetical protein
MLEWMKENSGTIDTLKQELKKFIGDHDTLFKVQDVEEVKGDDPLALSILQLEEALNAVLMRISREYQLLNDSLKDVQYRIDANQSQFMSSIVTLEAQSEEASRDMDKKLTDLENYLNSNMHKQSEYLERKVLSWTDSINIKNVGMGKRLDRAEVLSIGTVVLVVLDLVVRFLQG